MDVIERLTLETAQADTMLAREHRHRYEFASGLVGGQRVLDLCCGSGYGTQILAGAAQEVIGVDNDAATVELALSTVARDTPGVSFAIADAVEYLRADIPSRFDVLVCFEGLEHLAELEVALELLREHAERGLKIIASVPNGKLFEEDNPYHFTDFGYDEAVAAFARFADPVMVPQYLAEGSLIAPPGASQTDVSVTLSERDEPEYANHFLWLIGFDAQAVGRAHHGRLLVTAAPVFNRWSEDIKRAAWALRRENARLGRARLGKGSAAAASALVTVERQVAEHAALQERLRAAEARVAELEHQLGRAQIAGAAGADGTGAAVPAPPVLSSRPRAIAAQTALGKPPPAGEDPNSWSERHRRAAETMIPWIEQTLPLAGRTVLEYGCGNGAVSCALAAAAQRVIGVDIDPAGVAEGQERVRSLALGNVELELHGLQEIVAATRARRGQVDVFLLYAVLEHLTLAERLQVLELAREVVADDGAIVVCETPNRLTWLDHHTAQLPFFQLLPDELALAYRDHSERAECRAAIDAAAQRSEAAGLEAIARWGRGVSFHEFELVFGDLAEHVIASSYDPLLLPERPVEMDEVQLARFLERWRPDLAPAWSRRWLDVILSPEPMRRRPAFIRPWPAQTVSSRDVGYTEWDGLHLPGPEAVLWVDPPVASGALLVGVIAEPGSLELRVRSDEMAVPLAYSTWTAATAANYVLLPLPAPSRRVGLSASRRCDLVFVGYQE